MKTPSGTRAISGLACVALAAACLTLGYRHAKLALADEALKRSGGGPVSTTVAERIEAAAPNLIPASRYLRGRLALIQASSAAGPDGESAALEAALEDFRWVTARRPTWAPGWVAIVVTKARLHHNDAEFHHALERALHTGPNETRSFTELFPWLRLRWHWLDEAEREALTQFTVRAAWREPKWVVEQAQRYYFLDPLCRHSTGNRLAMLHCQRLGWTAEDAAA